MRKEIRQVYEDDKPILYTYTYGLDRAAWSVPLRKVQVTHYGADVTSWSFTAPEAWYQDHTPIAFLAWCDESQFGRVEITGMKF